MPNIITTVDEIKSFIAVQQSTTMETMQPYLDEAIENLLPIIGQAQWDKLVLDYSAESIDPDHLKLLAIAQKALVNFAYLLYSVDGNVVISDAGLQQSEDSYNKRAYQWAVIKFQRLRHERAWAALHSMLKLLYNNMGVYADWTASEEATSLLQFYLYNVDDFSLQRPIADYSTWWALRPSMLSVDNNIITPLISETLSTEIKTQIAAKNLTADNLALLKKIQPAIAHLAVAEAMDSLRFTTTQKGLYVESIETQTANVEKETPAATEGIYIVKQDAEKKGKTALRALRVFLDENATSVKYAGYYNSDNYKEEEEQQAYQNTTTTIYTPGR